MMMHYHKEETFYLWHVYTYIEITVAAKYDKKHYWYLI